MEYLPSFIDQIDYNYIAHHGIKGQHWGVRRPRNEDGILQGAGAKLAAMMQTRKKKKLDKLEKKRSRAQRAAGRDSSMQKHLSKQKNIAAKAFLAPTYGVASVSRAYHQHKANSAQRRIDRLRK